MCSTYLLMLLGLHASKKPRFVVFLLHVGIHVCEWHAARQDAAGRPTKREARQTMTRVTTLLAQHPRNCTYPDVRTLTAGSDSVAELM